MIKLFGFNFFLKFAFLLLFSLFVKYCEQCNSKAGHAVMKKIMLNSAEHDFFLLITAIMPFNCLHLNIYEQEK